MFVLENCLHSPSSWNAEETGISLTFGKRAMSMKPKPVEKERENRYLVDLLFLYQYTYLVDSLLLLFLEADWAALPTPQQVAKFWNLENADLIKSQPNTARKQVDYLEEETWGASEETVEDKGDGLETWGSVTLLPRVRRQVIIRNEMEELRITKDPLDLSLDQEDKEDEAVSFNEAFGMLREWCKKWKA